MLTAKVNTVNFFCGASFSAFCLELVIIQLYLYVVIASELDLVFCFALLGFLFKLLLSQQILKSKCHGYIVYSVKGDWQERHLTAQVRCVNTSLSFWCLLIFLSNGQVRLLWRDSCRDSVYRYLIVQEKQRRYTSAVKI